MAPRWAQLRAQRYCARHGDSAIAIYQSAVLDDRDDVDGWVASRVAGAFRRIRRCIAARRASRVRGWSRSTAPSRRSTTTSDLAVYGRHAPPPPSQANSAGPSLPAQGAEVQLRFGPRRGAPGRSDARGATGRPSARRSSPGPTAGSTRLADTAASFLQGRDASPTIARGAQYRLAIRAALGRWAEGYAAWTGGGIGSIDPRVVRRLSGFPARARASRAFEGPRPDAAGRTPDFSLPPWEELRQAFEALVYRAVVEGDSADTRELLQRIDRARPAGPSDPSADALRWSLRARLALLAHDSAAAVDALRRSVARSRSPIRATILSLRSPSALPAGPAPRRAR
jgi:hypothetical protein